MKRVTRKTTSFILAIVMLSSLMVSGASATAERTNLNGPEDQTAQYNPALYTEYTIQFGDGQEQGGSAAGIAPYSVPDESNIEAAKDFVTSLDLQEKGYGYIEESCLKQLEDFDENGGIELKSYTVLVPQDNKSSMNVLGTYNGRTFYYDWYSSYDAEYAQERSCSDYDTLDQWQQGTIDLILCFIDARITVPYTIISNMSDMLGYEVHMGAFVESGALLDARCRGVYVENLSGAGGYTMVTSGEAGHAQPFIRFHPVKVGYPNIVSADFEIRSVSTTNFYNIDWVLEDADIWLRLGSGNTLRRSLIDYPALIEWY